jgi:ketosteroid isomerase-like protein
MTDGRASPDLEEAFRRALEAFNRGDIDAAASVWARDAVYDLAAGGFAVVEGDTVTGRDSIRKLWEDLAASFDAAEFDGEEFHDLGGGVTFGVVAMRGKPRGSSSFVEIRFGFVSSWRDGRIARARNYTDIEDARAAAERLAKDRGRRENSQF